MTPRYLHTHDGKDDRDRREHDLPKPVDSENVGFWLIQLRLAGLHVQLMVVVVLLSALENEVQISKMTVFIQVFRCYNDAMLHLHNHHMRGTRLDALVGIAALLFGLLLITMIVGPARTLAKARDQVRTAHVRQLMTSVLQLELIDPVAYAKLVTDVQAQGDLRFMIGNSGCQGSHGSECHDAVTADDCLLVHEYFSQLLLSELPVDPLQNAGHPTVTGYYLSVVDEELEVGACRAAKEPITLRKSF